jgi:hypothetical protein
MVHKSVKAMSKRPTEPWHVSHVPGAPHPPRSVLNRGASPTTSTEMESMRRRVWHEQGVATFAIEEVSEPWLRQAITNEADRRWGQRKGGGRHGR